MSGPARWDVGLVAALVGIGSGVLLANTVLVAGAVIGLVFALYGSISSVPESVELAATRRFEISGAGPGSEVHVELDIENTGESTLPDLRVADGVPDGCPVVAGIPRASKPLGPGETLRIEYTVVLERGRFEFEDPVCRLRSFAGADRRDRTLSVDGDRTLRCGTALEESPRPDATLQHAGNVATDTGGSGLEFYSTRQYHHGDPMRRINWHQVAKTGEFVTVQYRREQAAQTVIVMDCRPAARVKYRQGYPTGSALAVYAAERIYEALDEAGAVTMLTAVGIETDTESLGGPGELPWVGPDSPDGAATALFRAATRTAADAAVSASLEPDSEPTPDADAATPKTAGVRADGGPAPGTGSDAAMIEQLRSHIPSETRVVVCSPLVDGWVLDWVSTLRAHENPCHVLSPDVTGEASTGHRIERIHRRRRIRELGRVGSSVTDWPADYPVEYALRETIAQL
jgi:uncharacterized protein (DUF58 family)